MGLLHLLPEAVAAEVGKGDQEVHEHTHLDLLGRLLDHLQHTLDDEHHQLGSLDEGILDPAGVDHVGEHGGREVEAEDVDLGARGTTLIASYLPLY